MNVPVSTKVALPFLSVLAALALAMATPDPASAQLPDSAISCRAAIAKNYAKLVKIAHKTIATCHKARDGAKIGDTTDCNDMTQADSKDKFSNTRTKVLAAIGTACAGENATLTSASEGTQFYTSCPVTCGALPNPMVTMAQVGECLGCLAEAVAEDTGTAALGSPAPAMLTKDDIKCRSSLAKSYGKYAATAYKVETSCQGDNDELGSYDPAGCSGFDDDGKVAGTLAKAELALDKSCGDATLGNLDTCATDTIMNLKACTGPIFTGAKDDVFGPTYKTNPTICPNTARVTVKGGCSTLESVAGGCSDGGETSSSSSEGWVGLAHDMELIDAVPLTLDLSCPGTVGICGACTVAGISAEEPLYDGFARCVNDPSVDCTMLFSPDPACGGFECVYYSSPPNPVSPGGTPLCHLSHHDDDISGTLTADTGSASLTMSLRSRLYTGGGHNRPCPVCRDDETPQDGVAGGTCLGGPRDGLGCDVQGFDLTYAVTNADAPTDGLSLDCPPASDSNLTGTGYPRTLPLTTGATAKPAVDACDGNPMLDCFCGVCSMDTTVVCDSDADCSGMGLGVCGTVLVDREPNDCADTTCEAVIGQTDRGECSGQSQLYCDGLLRTDGKGIITCATNAGCDALSDVVGDEDDWVCPGNDCGTCTYSNPESCFMDPIALTGTASTTAPVLVGITCLPPTANASINIPYGLPGPASVTMETILERRY